MRQDEDRHPRDMARGPVRAGDGEARFLWLAIVGLFVARLPLLPRRLYDPDEFEHAHAAWSFFKGMIPYRDFFEHHTPWYYFLLRPFFRWFAVDTDFVSATHFLLFGRVLSLVLAILSVWLLCGLGRRVADRRTGLLAGLFLVSQPVFLQKSLEIRGDMLALPFFLAGLLPLVRALRERDMPLSGAAARFVAAGLGVGAAIMCTQKVLFVLPGLLGGLGLWLLLGGPRPIARVFAIVAFLAGIAIPGVATWAWFAAHHAQHAFIANNFLLNAGWKHTVTGQFLKLVESSAPVLALAIWAVLATVRRFISPGRRDFAALVLACTLVGLFLGVLVIPVAQRQYYLLPLPLYCLFAAQALGPLLDRARRRARAVTLAIVALAVLPLVALIQDYTHRNDEQLARLHHVFDTTKPTDLVMDGWLGTGVFRPHAFYYYFIHEELLPMLSQARLDAYLTQLEMGLVRPKLIAIDENLLALGPRFQAFVVTHYTTEDHVLYYRSR